MAMLQQNQRYYRWGQGKTGNESGSNFPWFRICVLVYDYQILFILFIRIGLETLIRISCLLIVFLNPGMILLNW
jgi:hypothetical protein